VAQSLRPSDRLPLHVSCIVLIRLGFWNQRSNVNGLLPSASAQRKMSNSVATGIGCKINLAPVAEQSSLNLYIIVSHWLSHFFQIHWFTMPN